MSKTNFLHKKHNGLSLINRCKSPFLLFVFLPILLFTTYQILFASARFESRSQLIVQQPNDLATMDPSMALLSGFGLSSPASTDAKLLQVFIHSEDMLNFLEEKISLKEHFTNSNIDIFSRLKSWSSKEDFLKYYQDKVTIEIDEQSSVITILAQSFNGEYASKLNRTIVERAEWYINSISHVLANKQLQFINGEHQIIEKRLDNAKNKLLTYQQRYNLLDPEAEGLAFQQITYSLESQIATKKAELKAASSIMSDNTPQVLMLDSQIKALNEQLETERSRLSLTSSQQASGNKSISEVLSTFTELKIELELALQAYTSSQISLEKSRIETYRQLKYLITVESPTYPESNQYPKLIYNITLFSVLTIMLFGIFRIVVSTVRELK